MPRPSLYRRTGGSRPGVPVSQAWAWQTVRLMAAVLGVLATSGCGSPIPPALSTPVPTPTQAVAACSGSDIELLTREWGPAGGTTYAPVHVRLVDMQPCLVPATPAAQIEDAGHHVVAVGRAIGPAVLVLRSSLDLRLGWSSWCGPSPAAPLSITITLLDGSSASADFPAGFEASCQGVATTVFVEPVDPEGEITRPRSPLSSDIRSP